MLTYDQVVQAIDALDSYGYIRKKKIIGDWYSIYCPFHKDGQERKPSCGVLLRAQSREGKMTEPGLFHCFTCGHSAPLVPSVSKILSIHESDATAIEWLSRNVTGFREDGSIETDDLIPSGIASSITSKFALDYIASKTNGSKRYVPESELEKYRFTVPYMYERGLTDEIIDKYDVGFDANHIPENRAKPVPCVTFPVRDVKGRCEFIFRRSIEGRYFNYPAGVEKPVYGLYELRPNAKTVYICESAFNMLTLVRHGLDAVALFGTGNALQISQLKGIGAYRFVLALDPDDAGERGRAKLRRALKSVAFISELKGFPEGKDINDLTEEEFESLYVE